MAGIEHERVRWLTFDCYGTLVDWRQGVEDHLGGLLRRAGWSGSASLFPHYGRAEQKLERSYRSYRDVLCLAARQVAWDLGCELSRSDASAFANSLPYWPAFNDSVAVLRELGARGYGRYLLSNVDRDLLTETVARQGLEVEGFVTAEDVRSYKPSPDHWLRFLENVEPDRGRVLHVAQSLHHDIGPATRLGFATAWINRYRQKPPVGVRPKLILPDLESLLPLLPRRIWEAKRSGTRSC